jgi:hypothetical protein
MREFLKSESAAWGQRAQNKILIQLTFGPDFSALARVHYLAAPATDNLGITRKLPDWARQIAHAPIIHPPPGHTPYLNMILYASIKVLRRRPSHLGGARTPPRLALVLKHHQKVFDSWSIRRKIGLASVKKRHLIELNHTRMNVIYL